MFFGKLKKFKTLVKNMGRAFKTKVKQNILSEIKGCPTCYFVSQAFI